MFEVDFGEFVGIVDIFCDVVVGEFEVNVFEMIVCSGVDVECLFYF